MFVFQLKLIVICILWLIEKEMERGHMNAYLVFLPGQSAFQHNIMMGTAS